MMFKNMRFFILTFVTILYSQIPGDIHDVDTFGIVKYFPTKLGSIEWNSAHWNDGIERVIKYSRDASDPTDWTEDHSASTDGFKIDGKGVMNMNGGGPRFHINSLRTTKGKCQFYLNTEFTGYYRRIGSSGADYGGMVVGVRSGPLGHASDGGDDCDATTYYARFRHDGNWDFEKELKHPTSEYRSTSGVHTHGKLWNGNPLPENRWIGMKYIVYNIDSNTKVKLELYIDSTSGGNITDGGVWKKVGEVIDTKDWPTAPSPVSGCSYSDPATIITEGHGTILMRTDGAGAEYKMVSIREIEAGVTTLSEKRSSFKQGTPHTAVNTQNVNNLLGQKLKKKTTAKGKYIKYEASTLQ
ncbi:MAG TPA: hypothetical protein VHO70_19030 [Chitinispirillaceae bacterium]|nr:hypothetical protein [Chitinispirillaceae bacterium]